MALHFLPFFPQLFDKRMGNCLFWAVLKKCLKIAQKRLTWLLTFVLKDKGKHLSTLSHYFKESIQNDENVMGNNLQLSEEGVHLSSQFFKKARRQIRFILICSDLTMLYRYKILINTFSFSTYNIRIGLYKSAIIDTKWDCVIDLSMFSQNDFDIKTKTKNY